MPQLPGPRRSISLDGRNYDLFLNIFWARGEPVGFYSVALQPTFINAYGNTARNQMALIFAAALLLVFGIGYSMANAITGQLQHLMRNAMAVAGGDFSKRTEIATGDEIGLLARSLDHMTRSLATYTNALQDRIDELVALYDSSTAVTVRAGLNLDHVLRAVVTSIKASVQGIDQVVVYLLDESGEVLVCRNGWRQLWGTNSKGDRRLSDRCSIPCVLRSWCAALGRAGPGKVRFRDDLVSVSSCARPVSRSAHSRTGVLPQIPMPGDAGGREPETRPDAGMPLPDHRRRLSLQRNPALPERA